MADAKKAKTTKKAAPTEVAQEEMGKLEEKLSKQSKNMPQMSKEARSSLEKVLPWFSAAFALLSLVWVKDLWDGIRAIDKAREVLGSYITLVNDQVGSEGELWIVLIGYALVAIFVALAFSSGVLQQTKKAWNFLFYGYSVAVVTALLYFVLLEFGGSRAFLTLILGLGGLYALFQIREDYK